MPVGVEISSIQAFMDDRRTWLKDGKIYMDRVREGWTVKIKVAAVTSELLGSTVEEEITITGTAEEDSRQPVREHAP